VVTANLLPTHQAALEGAEELWLTRQRELPMRVGDLTLQLRPQSFFQTNTFVAAQLYAQAHEWVAELDPASAWDLYCGVGGFALTVALARPEATVTGVELAPEAVRSATRSAAAIGLDERVAFVTADATAYAAAHDAPDLVVVNPPRRGIGVELAETIERSSASHLLYSSCEAETLAADLHAMPSFEISRARGFAMFPQTEHAEVLVLARRRAQRNTATAAS
jgi:23S rRNA (uracil747-C5)-methyltransferase